MFSVSIKYLFVSIYFIFFASFIYADPYPIYKKLSGSKSVKSKNTEQLMSRHFHLPLHMMIKPKDANYIVKSLIDCSNKILKIS